MSEEKENIVSGPSEIEKILLELSEIEKQVSILITENIDLKKQLTEAKESCIVWHDLRKDPNDLPKATTPVLVRLESGVPYVSWISSDKGWWFCTNYATGEDKVIKWAEIPL